MPWWMLLPVAVAAPNVPVEADYRSYMDQARFFLKKDWYVDAEEQLALAVQHPDGKLDPEAWFLLARVRYELADLPGARDAASHALTQSRDPEQARQTEELLRFLQQQFGTLTLTASRAGVSTSVDVALTSVLLDPQLKDYFSRVVRRLDAPVVLPLELGLPAGRYTINGDEVEIEAGTTQSVGVKLSSIGLQTTEITVSGGIGGWFGDQATHLLPTPGTSVGVHFPMGALVVGARAGWWSQPRDTRTGELFWDSAWSVGLTAGVELPNTEPLVIRGAGSYRVAPMTAIRGSCDPEAQCVAATEEGRPLDTRGLAQVPGIEVSAMLMNRSRAQSLGVGLRWVTEQAFASAPASGTGTWPTGKSIDYTWTDDRSWRAPGMRILLDVSLAL